MLFPAEHETAQAGANVPSHPLIDTTDQWVNTSLRRLLRQAAESDAKSIAIPSGDTVLSYGMGGEAEGMKYAYDKMYPKNLRNILEKIDPEAAKSIPVDALYGMSGYPLERSHGFTSFPMTDAVRQHVLENGQSLFSNTGKPSAVGAALAGDHGQDQNAALMEILKQYGVKLD